MAGFNLKRIVRRHLTRLNTKWLVLLLLVTIALTVLWWSYPGGVFFAPQKSKVNQLQFQYLISPRHVCSFSDSPSTLVIVLTTVESYTKRMSIRETWGSIARTNTWPSRHIDTSVKFVYLFGYSDNADLKERLRAEASEFDDVLQIGITERYGINVTKKILMGFKWAKEHCRGTEHVIKVDDDVFVDLPQILDQLHHRQFSSYIGGHMVWFAFTKRSGKYMLSYKEYPFYMIPSYILGYFYAMPVEIMSRLLEASQFVPYVRMEDVYITAILSRTVGVQLKAFKTFWFDRNYEV
ncbi:lactosylceramide 1,3-N-acetyl-beta-D-glucosaminyltransferase-like [Haliotis asinina]|uniref:lactosylceramide 1,3-N-acetyl-beta-D-glucosaminyltransferase-like n=1 Tax=Haliotis asinina TaxID=109174 RepID=UPI0035318DB2